GLQIDADETFAEEVLARPLATVIIGARRLDRQIDQAQLLVDGDLRPHAGVAVDAPGVVLPAVAALFAGLGDGLETPNQPAGPDVERARQPLGVVAGLDGHPFLHRGPDQHGVLDDGRRRVQTNLTALQIDRLAGAEDHADLQIDDAVLAECLDRLPGLRVERDQTVAGRDVEDAVVAPAAGPV